MQPSNAVIEIGPAWFALIISLVTIVSTVVTALVNNLTAAGQAKKEREYKLKVLELENSMKIKKEQYSTWRTLKYDAISEFLTVAGHYCNSPSVNSYELFSAYAKVYPYLNNEDTRTKLKNFVDTRNSNTKHSSQADIQLKYETLALALADNELNF